MILTSDNDHLIDEGVSSGRGQSDGVVILLGALLVLNLIMVSCGSDRNNPAFFMQVSLSNCYLSDLPYSEQVYSLVKLHAPVYRRQAQGGRLRGMVWSTLLYDLHADIPCLSKVFSNPPIVIIMNRE
jgi:hypothetical protein